MASPVEHVLIIFFITLLKIASLVSQANLVKCVGKQALLGVKGHFTV